MDRHPVHDVLLSYDLSILVLQWLRLPDLIAFGGLCSASRVIMFGHLERLKRIPSMELGPTFNSRLLIWLNSHAPNLTSLHLFACKIVDTALHNFIPALSSSLRELHLTHLPGAALLDPRTPDQFRLPNLCVLNLSDSTFDSEVLTSLLWGAPSLECLRLRGASAVPAMRADDLLDTVGRLCPKLATIDISWSAFTGVSPSSFRAFMQRCPGIRDLGLTYVMYYREVSFIFRHFAQDPRYSLRSLSLGDIDAEHETFVKFMRVNSGLERLHLVGCHSGMGSAMITEGLLQSHSVTDLNLTGNDMNPDHLAKILAHCTRLRRLCLMGDTSFVFTLAVPSVASSLRELSVDIVALGQLGGASLARAATNLLCYRCSLHSVMDISPELYLAPLTSEACAPRLRVLVSMLRPHHKASFLRMLGSFPSLRLLVLPGTPLTTPEMEQIVRLCPKLRWLGLWPSLFTGPDSALRQLQREYGFRVIGLKESQSDDISPFDHALFDDCCAQELWDD